MTVDLTDREEAEKTAESGYTKPQRPFEAYFRLNPEDYTSAESEEIFQKYTSEGGFVGLMSFSTPIIIQDYCYKKMVNNPPLSDAGNDVLVLLKRQGGHEARDRFKKVFKMVLAAERFFSPNIQKKREELREAFRESERIRQEMLKNGCFAGSAKRSRPNPKGEFLDSIGLLAMDTDIQDSDPFDLSPEEKSLVSNVLDAGLASLEDILAPYLSKDKTLEKRFIDFLALCSVFIAQYSLCGNDTINKMYSGLDRRSHDQTRTPEQRENSRRIRDELIRVSVKRAVMRYCPALCLMEFERASAREDSRALELTFRHTNRNFWRNEAFCREAVKINGEALEWVDESIRGKCFGNWPPFLHC